MPVMQQLFIGAHEPTSTTFERTLFMIRKRAGRARARGARGDDFYIASAARRRPSSTRGSMLAEQVAAFYPDLGRHRAARRGWRWCTRASRRTRSPRGSARTRTACIAHNGEINTLRGNRTGCARARRCSRATCFGEAHRGLQADHPAGRLRLGVARQRRRLPRRERALAAARDDDARPEGVGERSPTCRRGEGVLRVPRLPRRAVGRAGGARASPTATLIGATLDRNGLRPAKYVVTKTASSCWRASSACSDSIPRASSQKGRLQPGKMFLVDTDAGRIVSDDEIKHQVATQKPYARVARREQDRRSSMLPEAHRASYTRRRADELRAAAAGVRLHRRGPAR